MPGTAALNSGGYSVVNSVSCATAGNCAAGGIYTDGSAQRQAFVVGEKNGSWGSTIKVPGSATLNSGGFAQVLSVSCATAGNCAAGGNYKDGSGHYQAFVVAETHGSWGRMIEVPGSATLNSGGSARVLSVSCATSGNCTAGGYYTDAATPIRPFVVSSIAPCVVPKVIGKTLSSARTTLTAASCSVGKITRVSARGKKGRVVAQHPKPGAHLKHGAKVALTLSKGKK